VVGWARAISSHWQDVHFGSVTVAARDGQYFFDVQIHLGRVKPGDVRTEIHADALDSEQPFFVSQ
jgi:hypothetical protein